HGQPEACAGHAPVPREAPGDTRGRLARRAARQDPARDSPRGARRRGSRAAHAVLRLRRRDAALPPVVRPALPVDGRPRVRAGASLLRGEAQRLRARFNEAFWIEDEGFFAGALDAEKRQVRTIVSNPGHGLYCDIVDPERATAMARRLLAPDMFSGWGIRTMSKSAAAYNPMSYHNGSVWPHDNAFIAAGLKRYGFVKETN